MNEIIAEKHGGEIVVRDPFKPDAYHTSASVQELIASANEKVVELRGKFDALYDKQVGDDGETENVVLKPTVAVAAVKALAREIKDADKTLIDYDKKLKDALLDLSGFKAFTVQTKGTGTRIDPLSVRGKFAAMLENLEADTERLDPKPQMPVRKVALVLYATDKGVADLSKKIKEGKFAGVQGYQFAPDEATEKKCVKLIEGK